jgi:hypothetical protein
VSIASNHNRFDFFVEEECCDLTTEGWFAKNNYATNFTCELKTYATMTDSAGASNGACLRISQSSGLTKSGPLAWAMMPGRRSFIVMARKARRTTF